MNKASYLFPDWPAPRHIKAVCSTRIGGVSKAPFNEFNLAEHVNDDPESVSHNRAQLVADFQLKPIQFINQVHGKKVVNLAVDTDFTADAAYTREKQQACAVLTADCLPLLVTDLAGQEIAAIHAGWRGLLAGVIDETINRFQAPRSELLVWLGPALGPCHLELNEAIRQDFLARNPDFEAGFRYQAPGTKAVLADIYKLARINLKALGVEQVYGGSECSYCDSPRFYSHRRDQGRTGRMVSMIWIDIA